MFIKNGLHQDRKKQSLHFALIFTALQTNLSIFKKNKERMNRYCFFSDSVFIATKYYFTISLNYFSV